MAEPLDQLSDPIDQACRTEQQMNDAALRNALSRSKPEQVQNTDGSWPTEACADCADDIGEARLSMGKVRCISCQQDVERLLARRGNLL